MRRSPKGVKRADVDLECARPEDRLEASAQRRRGGGCESDGQNAGWWHTAFGNQVCDPTDKGRGLAAAWTREDAERTFAGSDDILLRGREPAQVQLSPEL